MIPTLPICLPKATGRTVPVFAGSLWTIRGWGCEPISMEQMIPGGILYNILSLDTTVHTSWCRTAADSFLFHSSIIGEQVWNQTNLLYFLPDAAQPRPAQAPTRAWPFLRRCNDVVAEERLRPQAECGDDCAAVTCILSVLSYSVHVMKIIASGGSVWRAAASQHTSYSYMWPNSRW